MNLTKLLFLSAATCSAVSGWQPPVIKKSNSNKLNPIEPAGAESMFGRARLMRRNHLSILRGAFTNKMVRPWKRIRLRRGRRQDVLQHHQQAVWTTSIEDTQDRIDLNLPSWACEDTQEEERLASMKSILKDDLKKLESLNKIDRFPDCYSDFRLLRFLRKDKVQDPVAAALRFRDFVKERESHGHDKLRLLVGEKPFQPPPDLAVVAEYLPCDFQAEPASQDTNNMMVPIFLHVGAWNTAEITKSICSTNPKDQRLTLSQFLHYWVYMFDSLHLHLYNESLKHKQMIFIDEVCDLSEMSMGQFSPKFVKSVLKPWIRLTQGNYPETAKRIVFQNPPKILSLVWKIVTPMVSPGTVAKVSMQSKSKGIEKQPALLTTK